MMRFFCCSLTAVLLTLVGVVPAASASTPRILVSIPPVHSLIQGVLKDVAEAELLYSGGQSPHHTSLKPSDMGRLHDADLVVWVGPELESGLRKAMGQLDDKQKLTLSGIKNLPLLENREAGILTEHSHGDHGEQDHDIDEHEEHGHDEHDEHQHDEHGHDDHDEHDHDEHAHDEHGTAVGDTGHLGEIDPHLWLSSTLAMGIVESVTKRLIEIDPQNQSAYQDNAEQLMVRLDQWQLGARAAIEKVSGGQYMVFHDAYQYFEKDFGLQPLAAVSLNPQLAAGAKRLKLLRQQVVEENVICLFTEPQFEPDAATIIVEDTDARLGVLDPVGAKLKPGPDLWFELMDNLVDGFVECMK